MKSEMPHEPKGRQCGQVGSRDQCKKLEPLLREGDARLPDAQLSVMGKACALDSHKLGFESQLYAYWLCDPEPFTIHH